MRINMQQRSFFASLFCAFVAVTVIPGALAIPGAPTSFPKVRWCVKPGALQDCQDFIQVRKNPTGLPAELEFCRTALPSLTNLFDRELVRSFAACRS